MALKYLTGNYANSFQLMTSGNLGDGQNEVSAQNPQESNLNYYSELLSTLPNGSIDQSRLNFIKDHLKSNNSKLFHLLQNIGERIPKDEISSSKFKKDLKEFGNYSINKDQLSAQIGFSRALEETITKYDIILNKTAQVVNAYRETNSGENNDEQVRQYAFNYYLEKSNNNKIEDDKIAGIMGKKWRDFIIPLGLFILSIISVIAIFQPVGILDFTSNAGNILGLSSSNFGWSVFGISLGASFGSVKIIRDRIKKREEANYAKRTAYKNSDSVSVPDLVRKISGQRLGAIDPQKVFTNQDQGMTLYPQKLGNYLGSASNSQTMRNFAEEVNKKIRDEIEDDKPGFYQKIRSEVKQRYQTARAQKTNELQRKLVNYRDEFYKNYFQQQDGQSTPSVNLTPEISKQYFEKLISFHEELHKELKQHDIKLSQELKKIDQQALTRQIITTTPENNENQIIPYYADLNSAVTSFKELFFQNFESYTQTDQSYLNSAENSLITDLQFFNKVQTELELQLQQQQGAIHGEAQGRGPAIGGYALPQGEPAVAPPTQDAGGGAPAPAAGGVGGGQGGGQARNVLAQPPAGRDGGGAQGGGQAGPVLAEAQGGGPAQQQQQQQEQQQQEQQQQQQQQQLLQQQQQQQQQQLLQQQLDAGAQAQARTFPQSLAQQQQSFQAAPAGGGGTQGQGGGGDQRQAQPQPQQTCIIAYPGTYQFYQQVFKYIDDDSLSYNYNFHTAYNKCSFDASSGDKPLELAIAEGGFEFNHGVSINEYAQFYAILFLQACRDNQELQESFNELLQGDQSLRQSLHDALLETNPQHLGRIQDAFPSVDNLVYQIADHAHRDHPSRQASHSLQPDVASLPQGRRRATEGISQVAGGQPQLVLTANMAAASNSGGQPWDSVHARQQYDLVTEQRNPNAGLNQEGAGVGSLQDVPRGFDPGAELRPGPRRDGPGGEEVASSLRLPQSELVTLSQGDFISDEVREAGRGNVPSGTVGRRPVRTDEPQPAHELRRAGTGPESLNRPSGRP